MNKSQRKTTPFNVKQFVYNSLWDDIMQAKLPPGKRLSEQEIALKLNVSRTPVREAFINLAKEGLVEIFPQRGTFVTKIDLKEVRQAVFIRESLEVSVLTELIGKVTDEQISQLKRMIAEQETERQRADFLRFYELDEEFHRTLAVMSGYPRAWEGIKASKVQMDRVRWLSLPLASRIAKLIEQHAAIVQALEEGRAEKAKQALSEHLTYAAQPVEIQEKFQDYFVHSP